MKYEMEDQDQYCRAFTHEEWFDLLSTLKSKDARNRAADKIKRLYRQRAEPESDSKDILRVQCNNKERT